MSASSLPPWSVSLKGPVESGSLTGFIEYIVALSIYVGAGDVVEW